MERVGEHAREALEQIPGARKNGKRAPRGRQDRSGQEKVIKMKELEDRLPHLVSLKNKSSDAAKDFSSAVKAVAEKSGLLASVVRKVTIAKSGDNFDEKAKEAEQLELVFGKVAGA